MTEVGCSHKFDFEVNVRRYKGKVNAFESEDVLGKDQSSSTSGRDQVCCVAFRN